MSEDIRIRLADAMYDSIDRCARCKVCEHQCGAAAKVAVEAVSAERARAEAAEAKLTAIRELCDQYGWMSHASWKRSILAITGTGEEASGG